MNLIIQQIGADGNTKYLEKVATFSLTAMCQ